MCAGPSLGMCDADGGLPAVRGVCEACAGEVLWGNTENMPEAQAETRAERGIVFTSDAGRGSRSESKSDRTFLRPFLIRK